LYRDEVYNEHTSNKGVCEVNVALCRQGAPGTVALRYIGHQTRFENLSYSWSPDLVVVKKRGLAEFL
jgi:replicative DNA helicase